MQAYRIIAIVVTYNPEWTLLCRILTLISLQVNGIVIVDNGSEPGLALQIANLNLQEKFISLGENLGIAKAQNIGITVARNMGAEYVLLFDQDSEPLPDMSSYLVEAAENLLNSGVKVAAIGPHYMDERQQNQPPFLHLQGLRLQRYTLPTQGDLVPVDYLIASGSLIPITTLDVVGEMLEPLFIDFVDIEWGLRARNMGYQSFGCFRAHMLHALGDDPISFMGKMRPVRNPLRHYYLFRNAVWLYKQNWIPLNWKVVDGWRLFLKYGFYVIFAKPHFSHWAMMNRGIRDALRNRLGRY